LYNYPTNTGVGCFTDKRVLLGRSGNLSFTAGMGNYSLHNIQPGTYRIQFSTQDNSRAPIILHNVVVTDSMTTTANLSFNTGFTVQGTVNPALSNGEVGIYEAGTDFQVLVAKAQNITGGSYSIPLVPAGTYDIAVKANGPSPYLPNRNVTVSGLTSSNLGALDLSSTISGTVTDSLGLISGGGQLYIIGYRTTDNVLDIGNSVPFVYSVVASGGPLVYTYSMPVDPGYNYHLMLAQNAGNGFPPMFDALANVAPGSSNANFSTFGGHSVSGNITVAGIPYNGQNDINLFFLGASGKR
jgi:hypothetical protein